MLTISPCCTAHPWAYLTSNSLCYPVPSSYTAPTPLITSSLFFISVTLLLFCYICWFIVSFRFHISNIIEYFSIPIWLISLSITATTAAKSLQSCLTLCDPIDGSPPGSPVPGILQARTLEWAVISFSNLSLMPSKSIHVAADNKVSSL